MRYVGFVVVTLLLMVPAAARGQSESKSPAPAKQAVVLEISMVEADADGAAELQRGGGNKKRLDDLLAIGKASLIADVEIQAVYNRTVSAHMGRRVPIQVGSLVTATRAEARNPAEPSPFGFGIPQIQYQDTGINISATPGTPVNGKISVGLDLKLNDVSAPTATLTPVFISKSIYSSVTVPEGEMVPVLSIMEGSGAEPAEPKAGRPVRPPLRFMVLLTARSAD